MPYCTECKKEHDFPLPKFSAGEKAILLKGGYHHQDLIGKVVTIIGTHMLWSMPCDEVEYLIAEREWGAVLESRLERLSPAKEQANGLQKQ